MKVPARHGRMNAVWRRGGEAGDEREESEEVTEPRTAAAALSGTNSPPNGGETSDRRTAEAGPGGGTNEGKEVACEVVRRSGEADSWLATQSLQVTRHISWHDHWCLFMQFEYACKIVLYCVQSQLK